MYLIIHNGDILAFEVESQAVTFLYMIGDKRWQCDIRELAQGAFVKSDKALSMQIKASKMEWALT